MTSTITNENAINRQETHKLYTLLLPYSIYDNPYKQYSRKVKLKKNIHIIPNGSNTSNEFMIVSPYWTSQSSKTQQVVSINETSVGNHETPGIKTRKKMRITSAASASASASNENDCDMPKPNNVLEDEAPTNLIILKPSEYEKVTSSKYSLAELRSLCGHYSIKKSGTKTDLIQRIYTFLKQTYFIRRIQRNFKDFLSKKYRKLSGPGYLQTTKCVNDTDFYTFDKISNIKPMELFTYRDYDNKIYGFHIASIFHLIVTSYPTITNPYNRNIMPSTIIRNLYEKLIYGSIIGFRVSIKLDDDDDNVDEHNDKDDSNASLSQPRSSSVVGGGTAMLSREKQEELFIVDLFQHINTLGNYSDSEWFIVLQRDELIRFIRHIYDIWHYRANLSQEMKQRISPPNGNPFVLHNAHINLNVITLLTAAELRTICVSVIERMTRRGLSREDQCLGAFYVLATLTIVNQDARNALPWLYEAVL